MEVTKEKYINIVKVWNRFEEKMEEFRFFEEYLWEANPSVTDLEESVKMGREFISIKSDEHKKIIVRVNDIVSVEIINNPHYVEVEVK